MNNRLLTLSNQSEFVKRSKTNDKVKVFPCWFATTIVKKRFEVDQDDACTDEARREEERFQRRLERYKSISQQKAQLNFL